MAITLHTDNLAGGSPGGSTISLTCSANDLILFAECAFSTTPPAAPTMTGQTFTLVTRVATSVSTVSVWSTVAATAYSGATITIPGVPNGFIVLDAISGASGVDNSSTASGTTSTVSGSVTTVAANCRVFAYIGTVGFSVTGAGGGYTFTGNDTNCAGEISNTTSFSAGTNVTSSFSLNMAGGTWGMITLSIAPPTSGSSAIRRRSQIQVIGALLT